MSYKALLFCPDEKTARTVTQVLTELDFSVETSVEPFAAVKKLTSEHFDALVVDGENQQNATLLFKTARNSGSNQNSLAVAIVEGQSGVAKAFQIGANLVLTKPINVEQSKGTIRVARGLLRKTEAAKGPSTSTSDHALGGFSGMVSTPSSTPERPKVPVSLTTPPAGPAVTSPTALFEKEEEPTPAPEPTEAALLESMPAPIISKPRTETTGLPSSKRTSSWQAISQPMATALQHADQALGKTNSTSESITDRSVFSHVGSGAAAAAAPAREISKVEEEFAAFETSTSPITIPSATTGSSRIGTVAAVIVIAVATAGYFGWTKFHSSIKIPGGAPAKQGDTQPATSVPPATNSPTAYSAVVTATPPQPASTSTSNEPPSANNLAASKKTPVTTISVAEASKPASAPKSEVLVVNSAPSKPTSHARVTQVETESAPAPSIIESGSEASAVSGLVQMPANTPQAAPHTLRVSQGVSQGLLVKKVAPVYPQRALAMRIQGAVELLATVSTEGDVTDVKLLSGDTMLARAAMDAVKQWKYKPYYLDDKPLEIQTQITVNFKAPQE